MTKTELMANILFAETDKEDWDEMVKDATGIANVVINRTRRPDRFGRTYEEVIFAPNQFTGVGGNEWNKAVNKKFDNNERKIYNKLLQISHMALNGKLKDITGGADHYFNPKLASPDWGELTTPKSVDMWNFYYAPSYESKGHKYFKETLRTPKVSKPSPAGKKGK